MKSPKRAEMMVKVRYWVRKGMEKTLMEERTRARLTTQRESTQERSESQPARILPEGWTG